MEETNVLSLRTMDPGLTLGSSTNLGAEQSTMETETTASALPTSTTTTTHHTLTIPPLIKLPHSATTAPNSPDLTSRQIQLPQIKKEGDITLKFIFANKDGLFVTINASGDWTISDLKRHLLQLWPSQIPTLDNPDRIRMICMGRGMLAPDGKRLLDFKLPSFEYPTPVNVAIRLEEVKGKENKWKSNSPKINPGETAAQGSSSNNTSGTGTSGVGSLPAASGGNGTSGVASNRGCPCCIM